MKKETSFSTTGQRADIGDILIYRLLPNRYADKVGSFVFLDHIAPRNLPKTDNGGTGAHPHRGIATLTYVLDGEVEHLDSRGNHQKVHSGGIQWMKAGNGIVHDETLNVDSLTGNKRTHAFQFWINLPAKIKAEEPDYLAIESNEVPVTDLPVNDGWLKVILGDYQHLRSRIPTYSQQFLYHIHLERGAKFNIAINENIEVAAFLPGNNALLNDVEFQPGEFFEFDRVAGDISIDNRASESTDIILFGGEPYTEPIVAEGPFVMNNSLEIAQAYRDLYAGKYGEIK